MAGPQLPEPPNWTTVNDVDVKLAALTATMEGEPPSDSSIQVSLVLPGGFLTGSLVPQAVWAATVQEQVRQFNPGSNLDPLHDLLGRYSLGGEFVRGGEQVDRLHLIDATLHVGADRIGPGPWRVRIKDVSAWSLGAYA